MFRRAIQTDAAPRAVGPYSQAVAVDGTVYLSGQVPIDPATGKLIDGDFEAQVRRVLDNLGAVATAAGGGLSDIVRLTVYLADLGDFAQLNAVFPDYFQEPYPARSTFQVAALPLGARVEIDAVLVLPS